MPSPRMKSTLDGHIISRGCARYLGRRDTELNTLNLRQAIIQRVHDKSEEELVDVIESSIGNDERTLPGLGVLFELIWKDSDSPTQQKLVGTLHHYLSHTPPPMQATQ